MRKILPFLLIACLIVSCSGDDNNKTISVSIEGKWYEISNIINGVETSITHQEGCDNDYYIFTQNSYTKHYFNNITGECVENINTALFTIDGDKMTLPNGRILDIVQLDSETLKIRSNNQVDIDMDGNLDDIYIIYSRSITANPPTASQIVGKWVIYKAIYDGNTQPIVYDINGECGREILEFYSNKSAVETHYVDLNCNNGVGSNWTWWTNGSDFRMGYPNSDTYWKLNVTTNNELVLDGWDAWGYKKYYKKVQ